MLPSCRDVMLCSASNMSCGVSVEHSRASLVPTPLSDDLEIEEKKSSCGEAWNFQLCTLHNNASEKQTSCSEYRCFAAIILSLEWTRPSEVLPGVKREAIKRFIQLGFSPHYLYSFFPFPLGKQLKYQSQWELFILCKLSFCEALCCSRGEKLTRRETRQNSLQFSLNLSALVAASLRLETSSLDILIYTCSPMYCRCYFFCRRMLYSVRVSLRVMRWLQNLLQA